MIDSECLKNVVILKSSYMPSKYSNLRDMHLAIYSYVITVGIPLSGTTIGVIVLVLIVLVLIAIILLLLATTIHYKRRIQYSPQSHSQVEASSDLKDNLAYGSKPQVGASFDLNENPSYGSSRANIEGESEMTDGDGTYEVIDHAQ